MTRQFKECATYQFNYSRYLAVIDKIEAAQLEYLLDGCRPGMHTQLQANIMAKIKSYLSDMSMKDVLEVHLHLIQILKQFELDSVRTIYRTHGRRSDDSDSPVSWLEQKVAKDKLFLGSYNNRSFFSVLILSLIAADTAVFEDVSDKTWYVVTSKKNLMPNDPSIILDLPEYHLTGPVLDDKKPLPNPAKIIVKIVGCPSESIDPTYAPEAFRIVESLYTGRSNAKRANKGRYAGRQPIYEKFDAHIVGLGAVKDQELKDGCGIFFQRLGAEDKKIFGVDDGITDKDSDAKKVAENEDNKRKAINCLYDRARKQKKTS